MNTPKISEFRRTSNAVLFYMKGSQYRPFLRAYRHPSVAPRLQIGTLAPPDHSYSVPEASLEEQQEEEEEEEEEIHLRPQLIPQGSGGSGVLMGPDTQKGLEKHTPLGIYYHTMLSYSNCGTPFCSPQQKNLFSKGFLRGIWKF